MSHKSSLGSSWSMASSSSSSSDEDKSIQQDKDFFPDTSKLPSKSPATKGKKKDTKDTAYSRVDQAKQASQSKRDDGAKSKTKKSKSPIRKNEKESAIAGGSDKKKSTIAKQKTKADDTVFVSEQPAASDGTNGSKMAPKNEASTQPESSKAPERDASHRFLAPSVSFASDTLDDDLENLDEAAKITDGNKDENKETRDGDASSNDMSSVQDLRTTSITSSMIEVETSRSSKDSRFSSTSSAFEEINNVEDADGVQVKDDANSVDDNGDKEESSSSSDDADERPLSECQVDDEEVVAKEEVKEEASCAHGMLRKYWCYLLFSPFIVGNLVTVGRSLLQNVR